MLPFSWLYLKYVCFQGWALGTVTSSLVFGELTLPSCHSCPGALCCSACQRSEKPFCTFNTNAVEEQTGDSTSIVFPPVTLKLAGDYSDVGECI